MNQELPDIQAGFIKGRETRDQIANICWTTETASEFEKNIYFCFIDYTKAFVWITTIPGHLTCLLRNLYAGQEATVRTGHGTTDWLQIGKGVHQGSILPHAYYLYVEYITQTRLDKSEAGIKISRRHINNLRYAGDTTLMAENKEELKSLLLRVKEESEKLA